jgi:tetratricopeptide (TPR) repeat protein
MAVVDAAVNPFPGLRPFEPDEDHLFFGREREIDELLRRLRFNRFLSIVGTSGCGKSSLIRCGVIPSLYSGMMVRAGSSWRVSLFRPGEDPIGHLAAALDTPEVIGAREQELTSTNRVLVEAALRRGPRGLIDAVRHARIPPDDNLLVVVDQFEELFRFQASRQASHDEAVRFVKLLLEASSQDAVPIYVVITMRSDFIGDCIEYPGLPEALNVGQYLVPRMTRDALRSAITGPVAVAGGRIAPRLVTRLLNDLGADHDQLPVLQHALMRTWDHWTSRSAPDEPLDIADYEAVGTLRDALSRHAEEAYAEAGVAYAQVVERIFKALTDTVTDPRGTRRPSSIGELAQVAEVPEDDVVKVVELFRRPGRSFLMPPADVPLGSATVVDLSHESLMRCWTRLIAWADEERLSATMYLRVSRAAGWYEEAVAGLWRDPELELGLRWRLENHPTAAWARRYGEPFDRAMRFLDASEQERDRIAAERRAERRRQFRQLQWTAVLLAVLLLIAGSFAFIATRESERARTENARAEENLRLARAAVDESLSVAAREPSLLAIDFPELIGLRRQLLDRAQQFYRDFVNQAPASEEIRRELAFANLRLAHIDRALAARAQAAAKYREAIVQFEDLVEESPDRADYRAALANTYTFLGETLRLSGEPFATTKDAYDRALAVQEGLMAADAGNPEYRRDLARTRYNRGILYAQHTGRIDGAFPAAERDLRAAITLLEPLAQAGTSLAAQELGRVYNNIGSLLGTAPDRISEARGAYVRAVQIHETLVAQQPDNREVALELVKFYNNLADILRESGDFRAADDRNAQALALVTKLSRPAPSLSIERADSHNLRGRILQTTQPALALAEYRQALQMYQTVDAQEQASRLPDFHQRYSDLLVNLAFLVREGPFVGGAPRLLGEAVDYYLTVATRTAETGTPDEARGVLTTLSSVVPLLPEPNRSTADVVFKKAETSLRRTAADESSQ